MVEKSKYRLDKVVKGIKDVIKALLDFVDRLDLIVQQLGGWKTIIGGIAGAAVSGSARYST